MFQLPPDGGELWPSMQVVKMDASLLTAGGGWFLKGDGEHQTTHLMPEDCYTTRRMQNGHDPINLWRDRVDPRSYDPLMHKLAKAMLQMPKLQRLKLEFPNWYSSSSQGKCPSLEYYLETPSIRTRTSPRKASVWILDCNRSVYWPYPETGLFWEIPDHIMAAYRQLVKDDSIIQRVRYRIQLPSGRFPWLWA
ncbi:hypothetical protein M406DRAFT_325048 [Cryphonectria parasitica EP155]|uniref:Uncharacterized protein n=1 Tax=Cryphonectria parasitica (strain ATCC 38755 / EP155) TaxID=660469 RepID=A0A9P4YAQ2_CRYP1|nr:uncharacterized protein M406DRAFT_325048 [Cryphonectria parasitica EP155]KAF3769544.1 hypothetical protein M406DRAFT_325048 [Cryphonectria parasitica EP155]